MKRVRSDREHTCQQPGDTYSAAADDQLSWYQTAPAVSLELLDALHVPPTHSSSTSAFEDVTVLDVWINTDVRSRVR